jgi:hypothetical protein
MGGFSALCLCNKIQMEMPLYDFQAGTTKQAVSQIDRLALLGLRDPSPPQNLGKVRVDLLITVDAAFGPLSNTSMATMMRVVSSCVRRNVNYYQTTQTGIRSCGGPNTAYDPQKTDVENRDLTAVANHAKIDKYTLDLSLEAMEEALTGKAAFVPRMPTPQQ